MSKFTEQELLKLGFIKQREPNFHYFTFDNSSAETLITNASDELIEGKYTVVMFNVEAPKPLSKEFVRMYIEEFKK